MTLWLIVYKGSYCSPIDLNIANGYLKVVSLFNSKETRIGRGNRYVQGLIDLSCLGRNLCLDLYLRHVITIIESIICGIKTLVQKTVDRFCYKNVYKGLVTEFSNRIGGWNG